MSESKLYTLVINSPVGRTIGAPCDLETCGLNLAALYEEGYRNVELWYGLRRAGRKTQDRVVAEARRILLPDLSSG